MDSFDPISLNVIGPSQLINSKLNKIRLNTDGTEDIGELEDQFTLKLSDEELLALSKRWEAKYMPYEAKIKPRQNANKQWYMGKQGEGTYLANGFPIAANLLFESVETFIPAALAKNPEPVVWADNSAEGNELSNSVKTMLQYHCQALAIRPKLAEMTRSWAFNFMGVLKHGWDEEIKDIKTEVINPQHLILDPESKIDAYGDNDGKYIGERKKCTAQDLIDLFPSKRAYIVLAVDGKLGTEVVYTEWWSDEYCFYTFKEIVLDKAKNPHFNYPKKEKGMDASMQIVETEVKGENHFARPMKPYTFLSVFSMGEQPHDVTGLIEQNIPNQNRISKREMQIDVNLDHANNGLALNGNNFNEETGRQAATARQKGNPILVPSGGAMNEAILTLESPGIPDAYFKAADRDKQDLRSIFGVDGLGTTPPDKQKTLGGLLNNEQHDDTRIGGGIGDRIEGVASNTFNWWTQLYYVYYDKPHYAAIMGQMKAVEYITLQQQNFKKKDGSAIHLTISVTPDSMKPKDELTQMNMAMELWKDEALDPKTLLTMLNFPDPTETAEQVVLWKIDPQTYMAINFPEIAQKVQQMQQAQMQQQQAAQQQQMQMEGQQGEMEMQQKGAQVNQQLSQKEEAHQQKIRHNEEAFQQKKKQVATKKP